MEAQVAIGDFARVFLRGVHEVPGPAQHEAQAVLILKVLWTEDTGLVEPPAPQLGGLWTGYPPVLGAGSGLHFTSVALSKEHNPGPPPHATPAKSPVSSPLGAC